MPVMVRVNTCALAGFLEAVEGLEVDLKVCLACMHTMFKIAYWYLLSWRMRPWTRMIGLLQYMGLRIIKISSLFLPFAYKSTQINS
jgi:hypothetical protein